SWLVCSLPAHLTSHEDTKGTKRHEEILYKISFVRLRGLRDFVASFYFPSTENASSTLPGMKPSDPYPELTYSIPLAIVDPGPFIDPPVAFTPFTVVKSFAVSVSKIT